MTGPDGSTTVAERRQLVTFQAADQLFAADIFAVERVLRWEAPRLMPNVSPWLRGVVDHAGRTIPVVDLRERVGLPRADADERARILLLVVGDARVGLTVDAVHAVITVGDAGVEEPPALYKGLTRQYLQGVARHGEQLFMVLEVAQLLTSTERIEMERVLRDGTGDV